MLWWICRTSNLIHGRLKEDTLHGGRDEMRGLRGRVLFHLLWVFTGRVGLVWLACLGVFLFVLVVFVAYMAGENLCGVHVSPSFAIALRDVDRQGVVLARQCREKKAH